MKILSRTAWTKLTSLQKSNRVLSLEILRRIREGDSLTASSNETGLSKFLTFKHLGKSLIKKGGRWKARKTDSIQRAMRIYTKGKIKIIIINKTKYARIIGEYFNAIRIFLETGDIKPLKPFKKKPVFDYRGVKYILETDPKKIREIEEAKEDSEFFEIYSDE